MSLIEIICPCGRNNKLYKDCCFLVHTNIHNALTSEDLMRSRYSAFVLCNGDYLLKSHANQFRDPSTINNTININYDSDIRILLSNLLFKKKD